MEDFFDFSHFGFGGRVQQNTSLAINQQTKETTNCIDSMPLTMAYVPFQKFGVVYEPDRALCQGTVFPNLDKPFVGCKQNRRDINA